MNPQVNAIAGRLSLRAPQRRSLEILDRIAEIVPPSRDIASADALEVIKSEFPSVTDFERDFPSLCFALATGVGKTRLMGAFIAYLYRAHEMRNFFILAPGLTVYKKLVTDFTPNTPKYVFDGIAEFANEPPVLVTGENYEHVAGSLDLMLHCKINIFNIAKINTEVRGGRSPRIKRLSEYLGESYFDYLAGLEDLVLLMDESHRYRASAGVRAINELRPVLGLELTATPYIETGKGTRPFKNVIFEYSLNRAMTDGFVKEPAVVTRKDFDPSGMSPDAVERLKLEDGIHLHESVRVQLETYARETGKRRVKPFVLVIARDTSHAAGLRKLIQSDEFFGGKYSEKVIQIDSSRSGAESDEVVERLLRVERADEPTEIVIHVNMLKEGWDVTNLFTIVPLRPANARVLIEQSIGRGLRLPYGKRTGVRAIDRLSIVAHDRFQEIVDEANRPDSPVRLETVILTDEDLNARPSVTPARPNISELLDPSVPSADSPGESSPSAPPPFRTEQERQLAQRAFQVFERLEREPERVPGASYLTQPDIVAQVATDLEGQYESPQLEIEGTREKPDFHAVASRAAELLVSQTIDIPRIHVVPTGEVHSGFRSFALDLGSLQYQPPSEELWIQHLRTSEREIMGLGETEDKSRRVEDLLVEALSEFDDVSYEQHAELLYNLAGQVVAHFQSSFTSDETHQIVRFHLTELAKFIHIQMQGHYWEESPGFEVKVSRGFTRLREWNFTTIEGQSDLDFRLEPGSKSNFSRYVFSGFERCLYRKQKFDSDSERRMAVLLDRDSEKWMRPAPGQFDISFRHEGRDRTYLPDFVAETDKAIYMIEVKAADELDDAEVIAKRDVAVAWCGHASRYNSQHGGKPWSYLLIPHSAIAENKSLSGLAARFAAG